MFKWILDILLPKFCVGCGKEGLYICKDCEVFLGEVENTIPGLTSVWEYDGLMEKLIYKIKFDGCYNIIDELVEKAAAKINLNLPKGTIITFVPMWKKKERKRGFNQSELIARKLCSELGRAKFRKLGSAEFKTLLEKVRDNRSQVGLGPKERMENVEGVFKYRDCATLKVAQACATFNVAHSGLVPRNVLLVDDVYTTGATVNECIKVLKKAGVKNVWVFTLARKLRI